MNKNTKTMLLVGGGIAALFLMTQEKSGITRAIRDRTGYNNLGFTRQTGLPNSISVTQHGITAGRSAPYSAHISGYGAGDQNYGGSEFNFFGSVLAKSDIDVKSRSGSLYGDFWHQGIYNYGAGAEGYGGAQWNNMGHMS